MALSTPCLCLSTATPILPGTFSAVSILFTTIRSNGIKTRLKLVAETRLKTKTLAVQKQAETPMLFSQIRQPDTNYLAIPEVSGENRKYIPIGFLSSDVIASNKLFFNTKW